MIPRIISNSYNLLLALGAFYLGLLMFMGKGAFDTYPPEWIGKIPFTGWAGIAIFGIIIFGIGNAIASAYGFVKKDKQIYIITISMGALFFLCTVASRILLGEWYLPTGQFLIFSVIQILVGLLGLIFSNRVILKR
ncbi:hypothetical protein IEO70_14900 [Bacillus sp. AGMB 02131]|uniref:Uncharacterized protein n=1 Tax=Peribacillus faecalis TaxID=2772559 RepID=A0A927D238_9BACI|nr:hypothetical protein [Peribacillus faecalis]MBD3109634.1 hypothetical protein [Peribacillus faecalis]